MLWRLRTLQQLSIGINPSLRCAKVYVDAQLREQEREKEGGYRDGPFVAAVSKLCFHSHFATRGDSSLYHSAICYFVWSRSWPRGRNVCLFPQLPEGEIHSSFCLEVVCFCMHSCKCVCVRVHADVHMNMCAENGRLILNLSGVTGYCSGWVNQIEFLWFSLVFHWC